MIDAYNGETPNDEVYGSLNLCLASYWDPTKIYRFTDDLEFVDADLSEEGSVFDYPATSGGTMIVLRMGLAPTNENYGECEYRAQILFSRDNNIYYRVFPWPKSWAELANDYGSYSAIHLLWYKFEPIRTVDDVGNETTINSSGSHATDWENPDGA